VDTIDYFDIIEVNESLGKGELSLCSWLLKAATSNAATTSVITTISSCALLTFDTASSAGHSSTPDNIKAIIVNGNLHILLLSGLKLVVSIRWLGIHKETLIYGPSLNALAALEAVAVTTAFSVLAPAAPDRSTCKSKPNWLSA